MEQRSDGGKKVSLTRGEIAFQAEGTQMQNPLGLSTLGVFREQVCSSRVSEGQTRSR